MCVCVGPDGRLERSGEASGQSPGLLHGRRQGEEQHLLMGGVEQHLLMGGEEVSMIVSPHGEEVLLTVRRDLLLTMRRSSSL